MEWFTRTYYVSCHPSVCVPGGEKVSAVLLCFAVRDVAGAMSRLYIHTSEGTLLHARKIGDLGEGPLFGRGVWTSTHNNCDGRLGHGPLQRLIPTGMLKHDTWRLRSAEHLHGCKLNVSFHTTVLLLCFTQHHQSIDNPVNRVRRGFNRNNRCSMRGCALLLFAWCVPGGEVVSNGVVHACVSCVLSHLKMCTCW